MSNPIASFFDGIIAQVSAGTELLTIVNREQRARLFSGLFDSYYADREVMKLIYEFLGETPFVHNFENVIHDAPEFDAQLGLDGLHRVHPKVEPPARQKVLPPDLFERYSKLAFWRDIAKSKVYRIVARGGEQQATAMPQPTQMTDGAS